MILIVTNKLDPHADMVIERLKALGHPFLRFNTEDFPQKIRFSWKTKSNLDGVLSFPSQRTVSLSEIGACWYRRPSLPIVSNELITEQAKSFAKNECEAFLRDLWTYFPSSVWVNHPLKIKGSEGKMANLKIAKDLGFKIPRTLITTDPREAKKFLAESSDLVINKVMGKANVEYMKDYYFVYTHKVKRDDLDRLESVRYAPTIFQEYVPKKLEIRVTVVAEKVFSCEIHSQNSEKTLIDWRHYDFDNVKHCRHQLPSQIESLCFKMTHQLGLNFATFDLVLTPDSQYIFLEMNPNGQWLWIQDLTGLPISEAIAELLVDINQKHYEE